MRGGVDESVDDVVLCGDAAGAVPGDRFTQEFTAAVLVVAHPEAQHLHAVLPGLVAAASQDRFGVNGLHAVLDDAPAGGQVSPGDDALQQLSAGVVEINVYAAGRELPEARTDVLAGVIDAGGEAGVARHPVGFLAGAGDADRPRTLQHCDLPGHRSGRV